MFFADPFFEDYSSHPIHEELASLDVLAALGTLGIN